MSGVISRSEVTSFRRSSDTVRKCGAVMEPVVATLVAPSVIEPLVSVMVPAASDKVPGFTVPEVRILSVLKLMLPEVS